MGLVIAKATETGPSAQVFAARGVALARVLGAAFTLFTDVCGTTGRAQNFRVPLHERGDARERAEVVRTVATADRLHLLALRVGLSR